MTYSAEVLADSVLAYWRQGESSGTTMVDSSGNSHPGTYTNVPTFGVTGLLTGDADTANNYDGSADLATVTTAAWMDVTSITVEAWCSPDVVPSGTAFEIAGRDTGTFAGSSKRGWHLRLSTTGVPQFVFWASDGGAEQIMTGTTTVSAAGVYHVVGTYNGTVAKLYVNGAEEATLSIAGAINTGQVGDIKIGQAPPSNSNKFDGTLDEIAIYSTALSAARGLAHYNAGTGSSTPEVTASLTGTGTMSADVLEVGVVTGDLTGTGAMSADIFPIHSVTGALAGTGTFTAAVESVGSVDAELTGSGVMSAATVEIHTATADLTGTGTLTATSFPVMSVTAALAGTGTMTAVSEEVPIIPAVTGALAGTGTMTATRTVPPFANTDNTNRVGGRTRGGYGVATWEPPVVVPDAFPLLVHDFDKAHAFPAPTVTDGRVIPFAPTITRSFATACGDYSRASRDSESWGKRLMARKQSTCEYFQREKE